MVHDSEWGLLQLNIRSRTTGKKWTGNAQAEATSQLLLPNTVSTVLRGQRVGVTLFWGQRKTYTLNGFTGTGHGGSNSYQSSTHFISMLYCPRNGKGEIREPSNNRYWCSFLLFSSNPALFSVVYLSFCTIGDLSHNLFVSYQYNNIPAGVLFSLHLGPQCGCSGFLGKLLYSRSCRQQG